MPSNHLVLCRPLLLLPSVFPSIRAFSRGSVLRIRWPKLWSFSFNISPSKWIFRTDFFRIDWFDLLAIQGSLKSLQQPQFKIISSSVLNFLYGPTLTSIHDYWIYMNVIYINKRKHKITWSSPMHLCPTYVKRGKSIQWRKDSLFTKSGWENWTATCKRM